MACWAGGVYSKVERRIYEHIINDKRRSRRGSDAWGGVNLELITRVSVLESMVSDLTQKLEGIERSRASNTDYGLVRLSSSESVTESEGLSLPASEKNASVDGTLANKIAKIQNAELFKLTPEKFNVPVEISVSKIEANMKIVHLQVNFKPSSDITAYTILFYIPERFRPFDYQRPTGFINSKTGNGVSIYTDGSVTYDAAINSDQWLSFDISYCTS